ncbi:duodenase-1 isoform X1 [Lates calcarifer]|uniref:Duodenase-1 isoform X1 n=1 Tax=Lates calcarifer TaxID=8187 RepID=A0AAJ8BIY2_LATCA|nr:duodenase-1 isoform X1 [Lates calcarifer]
MRHYLFLIFPLFSPGLGSDIIDGRKSKENSMLYMASVQNKNGHVCGGFLVSEDFVMTAAHCDDQDPTSVVLGTHNLKKVNKDMKYKVKKKCKYPSYVNIAKGNDIMLLKLSKEVQLGNRMQLAKIPRSAANVKDNQKCRVAGWGFTRTGNGAPNDLRMVDVSIINQQVCRSRWGRLPANIICAGGYGTNKGFCQGDSGGPLECNGIVVGIVSFNRNAICDYPDFPNGYTDISKYLPWINQILRSKD